MIKDNVITFGHGTVLVRANCFCLELTEIKPAQKIGPFKHDNSIEYGEKITIDDYDMLSSLEYKINQLKSINLDTGKSITTGKYTFVFIAGADKSLDVVKRGVTETIQCMMMPLAC